LLGRGNDPVRLEINHAAPVVDLTRTLKVFFSDLSVVLGTHVIQAKVVGVKEGVQAVDLRLRHPNRTANAHVYTTF